MLKKREKIKSFVRQRVENPEDIKAFKINWFNIYSFNYSSFIISMIETGTCYKIESKHSGRVLDVCQDTGEKGLLIIYDSYGTDNQTFIVT